MESLEDTVETADFRFAMYVYVIGKVEGKLIKNFLYYVFTNVPSVGNYFNLFYRSSL